MRQREALYIVVDANLSPSQRAVQAAHAVAQFMLVRPGVWKNETLVLLKDKGIEKYLFEADAFFQEPDLDYQVTAVAFYRTTFIDLPLL